MNSRLSGQFDSCLFFIIQYFLINKGISITSDLKKKMSRLFNDFGLKCLIRSTDMHEIDYTFFIRLGFVVVFPFFFPFFFFFFFFSSFPPKVIWRGGGGRNALH